MMLSIDEITGYRLRATDGDIGEVSSFYFDERDWNVRYLVARTGRWFGREVLLSPSLIGRADSNERILHVNLSRERIKQAPDVDLKKPVSRQQEEMLARYYGWPPYWASTPVLADERLPAAVDESHLRSSAEVIGYSIHAVDGDIGHAEDLVLDDESWTIRLLIVDTRNWLPGRTVALRPASIDKIEWARRKIHVSMTRAEVEARPGFDRAALVQQK